MNRALKIAISLFFGLLLSCGRKDYLLKEGETFFKRARQYSDIDKDAVFDIVFPEVLGAENLQIVSDTVLVIQNSSREADSMLFKAYSTKDYRFLGAFGLKGRGPGEFNAPLIVSSDSKLSTLYIRDNGTGEAYMVDLENALNGRGVDYIKKIVLPGNNVDWVPFDERDILSLVLENDELTFQLTGSQVYTFHPYKGIDANRYITKMSSLLTGNKTARKVACAMVCFPQIIILNASSYDVSSFAVDPSYRRWKSILNSPFGLESMQYYKHITSSDKYIIALYDGCSISTLAGQNHVPCIHVFNWDGEFLNIFRIKEAVRTMTMDSESTCLYCIDDATGKIIRYDLSKVLK